jgi:tetratricopeptide (TPR) repeat protein
MADNNAYAILGLTKDADEKEIKTAYINLVKKYDPEKHTERFMVIQRAYDRLRVPKARAQEDIHTYNIIRGEFLFQDEEKSGETAPDEVDVAKLRGNYHEHSTDPAVKKEFVRILFRRAHYAIQRKQFNDAIRDFGEIAEIDPSNLRGRQNLEIALVQLGHSYALHGLHDEAVELWERALQLNPDNSLLVHNLALVSEKGGDGRRAGRYWAETVTRWKSQLEKDNTNDYLRTCITEALNHHGEFVDQGRAEVSALPTSAFVARMGGASGPSPMAPPAPKAPTAPGTGQTGEIPSSSSMRTSTTIQKLAAIQQQQAPPPPPQPTAGAGQISRFKEIAKLNPEDFDAQYQYCNKLMEGQQWDEALEELRALHRKHPKNVEILNLMGWALLNSGKVDDAFMSWKRSMSIDPKNPATREQMVRAHIMIGRSFRAKGIFTKALVHFKQLMQLMPNSPEVHLEIAATYDMKGDLRNALASYEEVLKLDPKHKVAKKAVGDLKLRR